MSVVQRGKKINGAEAARLFHSPVLSSELCVFSLFVKDGNNTNFLHNRVYPLCCVTVKIFACAAVLISNKHCLDCAVTMARQYAI